MKTVVSDNEQTFAAAAEHIRHLLASKPNAVLALDVDDATERVYERLAALCRQGELSLSRARVFTVAEYAGLEPDETKSHRRALEAALLATTDLARENCVFLSETNLANYGELIADAGGLDLALLGIGDNGRIGFNEPATPFDSETHIQQLTPATLRELNADVQEPVFGLTMGIKTLTDAKEVVLVSQGERKAGAVFNAIYGRTDSTSPAAFLQIPLNVTFYLDAEAAQKL